METLGLLIYLLLSCVNSLILGERPRMIFTDKNTSCRRLRLIGPDAPVKILTEAQPDTVTAVGPTHISLLNFRSPQKVPVDLTVEWEGCAKEACNYNITVVHKMQESNQVFVCGTNGRERSCCIMNISEHSAKCISSDKEKSIKERMRDCIINQGEPSALVEGPGSADLYITNSGSQDDIGIRRFGRHSVRPANKDKEQRYVELVVSKQESTDEASQDKIYAFYNEKNKDTDMSSAMWLPFVTQVCMADIGGPKNNLQFIWTSQMNARLFCGDPDKRQHFSELVDIATVVADRWQDTRVYALFKNEWGMSAVCVYTIQDIDNIFKTSPFKNSNYQPNRPRMCVSDSTKMPPETLRQIEASSEMEQWVQPIKGYAPLLFSHHHYTHIYVDNMLDKRNNNHTILFLSLNNGAVHKVLHKQRSKEEITFVIAEYRPFNHRTHIVSMILNPSTRMLYVTSRNEVVQLDMASCHQYGNTCEECVLARDPYCGWNGLLCTADGQLQDIEHGNHAICSTSESKIDSFKAQRYAAAVRSDDAVHQISVPLRSRYFFECPVSSHHAQYTWYHKNSSVSCSWEEQPCLFLIPSLQPEQVGTHTCVSEERGYSRVLARYHMRLEDSAVGYTSGTMLWLCLVAALLVQS